MIISIQNGILPSGTVILPPSKSEAIRAALLLGLCGSDPLLALRGFPDAPVCADVECAINASYDIGAPEAYVGGSAALMRMILPYKLIAGGAVIYGEPALLDRGIREIEDCLGVKAVRKEDRIIIDHPSGIREQTVFAIDCSRSSQFLSGLLIALPLIGHECEIVIKNGLVSKPYTDMTLDFVRLFGGIADETATGYTVCPSVYSPPDRQKVTGDRSYAAVFEAMNALGGSVNITGATDDTRQPDKVFLKMFRMAECDITDCPDLLPVLAAAACGKTGDTVIRGTARLKDKESDRASGIVSIINALGGSAETSENAVVIHGSGCLIGGRCSVSGDHRLAFAAAVMAVISEKPVVIDEAECVNKSAPQFWNDLERIGYGLDRKQH